LSALRYFVAAHVKHLAAVAGSQVKQLDAAVHTTQSPPVVAVGVAVPSGQAAKHYLVTVSLYFGPVVGHAAKQALMVETLSITFGVIQAASVIQDYLLTANNGVAVWQAVH